MKRRKERRSLCGIFLQFQESFGIAAINLLLFSLGERQAFQERIGPIHKLTARHEEIRAIYQMVKAHEFTRTVKGGFMPTQGRIEIPLVHILAGSARDLTIFVREMMVVESQVNPPGEIGQSAAQVSQDQYEIRQALEQTAVEQFHRGEGCVGRKG